MKNIPTLLGLVLMLTFIAFGEDKDKDMADGIPAVFDKFYNVEGITLDGDTIVINTKDLPDHTSPFYPESDSLYEAYTGDNEAFSTAITIMENEVDPDLTEQDLTFRIPLNPVEVTDNQATNLGPIGVAINGVVFFNQYNGKRELLDEVEFNNIDQWNGHPAPRFGAYHYHTEPTWLTQNNGSDSILGFLLDGFPIYGPVEDGLTLVTSDLDAFHGHFGVTEDYPDGVYHYHVTEDIPWINGDGFKGNPGRVIM